MSIRYPLIIAPNFLPAAPRGTKAFWGTFKAKIQGLDGPYEIDQWGQLWQTWKDGLPTRNMLPYTGMVVAIKNHWPPNKNPVLWEYAFWFSDGQLALVGPVPDYLAHSKAPLLPFTCAGPGASRPFVVTRQGDAVVASVSVIHAAGKVIVVQVEMETKGCRLLSESLTPLHIFAPDSRNPTTITIPCLEGFECQCVTQHARYAFRLCGLLRE